MNLQEIINDFESGGLLNQPDPILEQARLEVEVAADQARDLPTLGNLRETLFAIESSITRTLVIRYGCND